LSVLEIMTLFDQFLPSVILLRHDRTYRDPVFSLIESGLKSLI